MIGDLLKVLLKKGVKPTSYDLSNGHLLLLDNGGQKIGSVEPDDEGGVKLTITVPGNAAAVIKSAHQANLVQLNS